MTSSGQKSHSSRLTFWKVWTFFFLFSLLTVFIFWFCFPQRTSEKSRKPAEDEALTRVQELSSLLESHIIFERTKELRDLGDLLRLNRANKFDQILEDWLVERGDIICVSLWLEQRKWPVRITRDDFWATSNVKKLTAENRKTLFSFLFPDKPISEDRNQSWFAGQILPSELLGFPVLPLGIPVTETNNMRALEVKIGLRGINEFLEEKTQAGETFAILDSHGDILFSSEDIPIIPEETTTSTKVVWDGKNVSAIRSFVHLPWKLYFGKRVLLPAVGIQWLQDNLLYIVAGVFLWTFIFSIILSKWIDRPMKRLIETAAEIARGNFALRIPPQRNRVLKRLSKLFNYMAEEMDHLQKIDVSEIINEKNKTETILRNIADGVLVTDPQDRILVMNTIAEKWFGLDEEKVSQKTIQECIKNEHLISLLQKVKDGQIHSSAEFILKIVGTRDKKVFQAHAARLHNRDEELVGVVTVIRDVTKEKEAERIKTELVSMVAHELKSPLTSIYGFSELLLEANLEDSQAIEYAQVILTESTRLTDLVNKFLDISRLEAGRTEIRMNPFDLRQLVEKIKETYKGQAEKRKIRVIVEIPKALPMAYGDQDMIEQVLLNLFSNAVKYSPVNSKVGIEAKEEDDALVVSVIDNGYGIPKEALPRIFDKFYRVVDSEGSDEVEGSGLGLSLAKEIVEQHGGTIKVTSRLGIGSVFSFTLPKAEIT